MMIYEKLKCINTLLIDDDEWIRNAMCIVFESEGCSLTAVETAEEALRELKLHNYGVIICDYKLPGMDGLQFFREIRSSFPESFKIMITAYGNRDLLIDAKKAGVHDIIEKPFSTKTIETSLCHLYNLDDTDLAPDTEKGDKWLIE